MANIEAIDNGQALITLFSGERRIVRPYPHNAPWWIDEHGDYYHPDTFSSWELT